MDWVFVVAASAAINSFGLAANASWSFDRKLAAWAEVLRRHGVVA